MPSNPSIPCKTVWLHANPPVSRLDVDSKVTISLFLIGLLLQGRVRGKVSIDPEEAYLRKQLKYTMFAVWKTSPLNDILKYVNVT